MDLRAREHIQTVMTLAGEGLPLRTSLALDGVIRESWTRCVHEHRLDPTCMRPAVILHCSCRTKIDPLLKVMPTQN